MDWLTEEWINKVYDEAWKKWKTSDDVGNWYDYWHRAIARAAVRKVVEWAEQWAREYEPDGFGQLRAVRQFAEALRQEVGL